MLNRGFHLLPMRPFQCRRSSRLTHWSASGLAVLLLGTLAAPSLAQDASAPVERPAEPAAEPPAGVPIIPELPPEPPTNGELVNPLELRQPDPLLPTMVLDRPLNPQERAVLQTALDELQRQGQAALEAGDLPGALALWNRELRLRRFLGPQAEIASLARVGEVAWRQSQTSELRFITLRLEQIEQELTGEPVAGAGTTPASEAAVNSAAANYDVLLSLAQAYQAVRAKDRAVALYEKLLVQAQQQQDTVRQQQLLSTVAELHLGWFDYTEAANAYERLLVLSRAARDSATEIVALQKLAAIYQDSNQPEPAIAAQQQLVEVYQKQQNLAPIPALKLAIGDNYVALNRPDLAATSYQEAFAVARSVQQLAYASDALQRLASLYQSLNRLDDALIVYQLLLDVERQSYNSYGQMNTYAQIGQLHATRGESSQALAAFQQGLQIAQQLNYKVDFFNARIQEMMQ
ncbi:MAG: tetratricopeptide repeat protein [Synechococcales cyanobacterium C42_A2020_086]|nr:tetratricopeptide repeat protein [Synechococcales cyanobacterium C42_A2020_086]